MWETLIERNVRINFVGVKSWLLFSCGGEMIVCNLTPVSELQHFPKNVIMELKTGIFDENLKWSMWQLHYFCMKTFKYSRHNNINNLM